MTPGDAPHGDLADLRGEFNGSGFVFGTIWASAGSGPDPRRLYASRNGMLLTAWNAAELRIKLRQELACERRAVPQ